MTITPISPAEPPARAIIAALDAEIMRRYPDGEVHGIDVVNFNQAGGYFVLGQEGDAVIACGAFRPLDTATAEIKRMFVHASARKKGCARQIMRHLEAEIRQRGHTRIVLETGIGQPEAMALYESEGYVPIPTFGEYIGNELSRCYAKKL